MNILLLGPQGSGKGTQAKRIADDYGLAHISTGDILRAEVAAGSPLGLQVRSVMDAGKLVSDELILAIIQERLGEDDTQAGFVLDGFPRNIEQANQVPSNSVNNGLVCSTFLSWAHVESGAGYVPAFTSFNGWEP